MRRRLLDSTERRKASGNPILVKSVARRDNGLNVYGKSEQFSTTGAQLFDKDTVTLDSYINDGNGNVLPDSTKTICASDYISVSGLSNIFVSGSSGNEWMAFYDSDKAFVSGKNGYGLIQVPENSAYARFTIKKDSLDTCMINEGTTAKPYEPYTGGKPSPSPEYPQEIVSAGSVMTTGAQLFDISRVVSNDYVVNNGDGSLTVNSIEYSNGVTAGGNAKLLNYCPNMEVGKTYTLSAKTTAQGTKQIYLESSQSVWIFGKSKQITEEDLNSNVYWYADDVNSTAVVSDIMINEGSELLPYEPYTGGKPAVNPEAGEIGVEVYGGNLLKPNSETDGKTTVLRNVSVTQDNMRFSFKGTSISSSGGRLSEFGRVTLSPGIYYLSAYGLKNNFLTPFLSKVSDNSAFESTGSFEVTEELELILGFNFMGNTIFDEEIEIMLNVDSEPLPYEPYKQSQTVTFNTPGGLPGIPVNSNGNYTDTEGQQWVCDSIEYHRGKLSYVQRVKWIEFDGSEDEKWSLYSNETYKGFHTVIDEMKPSDFSSGYCNLLPVDVKVSSKFPGIWLGTTTTSNLGKDMSVHNVNPTYATTVEEWKTWLSKNPIKVLYQLETPIVTPIEDTELIEQLKEMHTNRPTTTVLSSEDCGIQLEYKTKKYLEVN